MSAENIEVVRRMFEAYARGGFRAVGEFVHPDFEMSQIANHPLTGTYRGPDAAKVMSDFSASFEDFRAEPEEIIDASDDRVVVALRERGRPAGARVELDQLFGILFTLRGGKVVRMEWFDSPAEALAAARDDD
jgi:uncharacterized protein